MCIGFISEATFDWLSAKLELSVPILRLESEILVSNRFSWRPSTEESNGGLFGSSIELAAYDEDCTHFANRRRGLLFLEDFRALNILKFRAIGVFDYTTETLTKKACLSLLEQGKKGG